MIDHAIVFSPVGAAVYWDEDGCHAVRVNDENVLVSCDSYLSLLLDGTVEAQRLKDNLEFAKLQSTLGYWLRNHRALRAIIGTLDPSLAAETSQACMSAAEALIKDDSTLHFVTCRLLGCRPPEGLALEKVESQVPNYPLYGWLIGLLKKHRDIIDIVAEFAEDVLDRTKTGDTEKLSRELVDSGFLASHVARIAEDNKLTNLLEQRCFDRAASGNVVPYEHPLLKSRWAWPYYVGRQSTVEMELKTKEIAYADKLKTSLPRLLAKDDGLRVSTRSDGALFLGGQSEGHLNSIKKILEKQNQIELQASDPRVAYRELVIDKRIGQHTCKVIDEHAFVSLSIEPRTANDGNELEFALPSPLPKEYVRGIEKGVEGAFRWGRLGAPLANAKVRINNAQYHPVDSSESSFEIAGREACREALENNTKLVEPIVKLDLSTFQKYSDAVVRDLAERAWDVRTSEFGVWTKIEATARMSRMLGYHHRLQELTEAGQSFSTQFSDYAVPEAEAEAKEMNRPA